MGSHDFHAYCSTAGCRNYDTDFPSYGARRKKAGTFLQQQHEGCSFMVGSPPNYGGLVQAGDQRQRRDRV